MSCSNVFENVKQTITRSRDHLRLGHPATLAQRLPAQHFEFNDDWLYRSDAMANLIDMIEAYLSAFFPSHQWHAWRRLWPVNLCQLLTYLHLAQGNFEQAMHMSELWRITGATPGTQRAAAELATYIRDNLLGENPDRDALAAYVASIAPEHRFLVAEPRLNPFRHVADQPEPLAWESTWNRHLREEYERFFASFKASTGADGPAEEPGVATA
jgi:hypothetical protein